MEEIAARRCLVQVVAAVCVLLAAADARASPSAKLVYIRAPGAETCPGEVELRKAVAIRIGYDPFFPVAQKTVVAQVQRVPKGFRGKAQIVGDDGNVRGERELSTTGDDCGELVGALALAVSIALDDLDEGTPAPTPSAPPAPSSEDGEKHAEPQAEPAAPVADKPPVVVSPPTDAGRGSPELAMSLGPLVSIGSAPAAAAGASLAGALRFRNFALRLDVRGDLPASSAMTTGGRVATHAALATVSACVRGRLPFFCAGPGAGILFARTSGITREESDQASLLVLAVRGGADVALGTRLYLEPFAEVGASLLARKVLVDTTVVHETAPFWGALGLHLGGRLF